MNSAAFIPPMPVPMFTIGQFAASPPKQANKNWQDLPAEQLECRWVDDLDELIELAPAWKRLAACCLCPNVFYEPQLLIPAWRHLRGENVRVLVVQAAQRAQPGAPKVLCGMLPLELQSNKLRLPLLSAKMWQHTHCFLTTPLIRSDVAAETLTACIEFLSQSGIAVLHMPILAAEGPFQHALAECIRTNRLAWQQKDLFRRALFVRKSTEELFLDEWPRKRRHELNRLQRRLEEAGGLVIEEFHVGDDAIQFADQFLALESLGWKGLQGTAMAKSQSEAQFLRETMIELAAENRLMGLAMRLDGQTIAMKTNFLTHNGGFAFKICYHPEWAKFSPGAILEKVNVSKLHETNRVQWMDSCAAPDHPMIDSLWPERRLLQAVALSTGGKRGRIAVCALPMAKLLRDSVKALRQRNASSK